MLFSIWMASWISFTFGPIRGWGLLVLSGGGMGTLGLTREGHDQCVSRDELVEVESDLEVAQKTLASTNETIDSLIKVIRECNPGTP